MFWTNFQLCTFITDHCVLTTTAIAIPYSVAKTTCSLQEIIQNADDARATEVKFFIDERSHGQQNLLHPSLAKFQGPSLLAYNDAVFTDEDWTNIQKLKRSDKRSDPFKIGKFGVGFNSVFHVTGA